MFRYPQFPVHIKLDFVVREIKKNCKTLFKAYKITPCYLVHAIEPYHVRARHALGRLFLNTSIWVSGMV